MRRDADAWRRVFQRQQASGFSIIAFCRNEGIAESTFYRWRAQLGQRRAPRHLVVPKPTFVDLGTLPIAKSPTRSPTNAIPYPSEPLELHLDLGGGLSLHLVRR